MLNIARLSCLDRQYPIQSAEGAAAQHGPGFMLSTGYVAVLQLVPAECVVRQACAIADKSGVQISNYWMLVLAAVVVIWIIYRFIAS